MRRLLEIAKKAINKKTGARGSKINYRIIVVKNNV